MSAIAGAIHPRYHDCRRIVGFNAAIQQVERLYDHSTRKDVVNGDPVLVVRFRIV